MSKGSAALGRSFLRRLTQQSLEDDQQPDPQSSFGRKMPKCFCFLGPELSTFMLYLGLQRTCSRESVVKVFLR